MRDPDKKGSGAEVRPAAGGEPPGAGARAGLTGPERLLLLDLSAKSGLPAKEFALLVGVSPHTLYDWKRRFELDGLIKRRRKIIEHFRAEIAKRGESEVIRELK